MSHVSLISELEFSLRTRGIKIAKNKDDCIKNMKLIAEKHLWREKTINKFQKYLDEIFEKIDIIKEEEQFIEDKQEENIITSSSLISELEFSLRTRGIKIAKNKDDCIKNMKLIAEKRLWKIKTMDKFQKYLNEIFEKIDIAKEKERICEDEKMATIMEQKLNNLASLNYYLVTFGETPQKSINEARKLLKTKVFIGIYDLHAGRYDMRHETKSKLGEYLFENPEERIFPRNIAKKYAILKLFLQHVIYNKK